MFVDELTITARAGDGGNGVIRWRRENARPLGGPSGGNGGRGGDVYIRAVRDLGLLSAYTGAKEFCAQNGESGGKNSQYGKNGVDLYINVPRGAKVTDQSSGRVFVVEKEGEVQKILIGGQGGLGNEYFKSSTNRSPEQFTPGKSGERSTFYIELSLLVDVGLIGLPNAGKSTLLNALTGAHAKVGAYPFTTLEPHLGEYFGVIFADIPGLIEGANEGKGLGHKFLRHIERTKMLFHCVSLENEDPIGMYGVVRYELEKFSMQLLEKEEWIILTKSDLVSEEKVRESVKAFTAVGNRVFVVSAETADGLKALQDATSQLLSSSKVPLD